MKLTPIEIDQAIVELENRLARQTIALKRYEEGSIERGQHEKAIRRMKQLHGKLCALLRAVHAVKPTGPLH